MTTAPLTFYDAPGSTGERRRQARALYPAYADDIAGSPAIAALVDAGRPFEGDLLRRLSDLLPADLGPRLGAAALRRLRTVPAESDRGRAMAALECAALLPVDWLPGDGRGWLHLLQARHGDVALARELGLDPAAVFRATGAATFRVPAPEAGRPVWTVVGGALPAGFSVDAHGRFSGSPLFGARDMARSLRDTLLLPLAGGIDDQGEDRAAEALRLAGAILFADRPLGAIDAAQRRWHEGLPAIEGALPGLVATEGTGPDAWPAAFAPFRASNGLAIACLTDPASLRAEGMRGPDADGIPGLDHCVGGYAAECRRGLSHVASVRRVLHDGRAERLSTIEILLRDRGEPVPFVHVEQHMGRGNRAPPPEAEAALGDLLTAIRDGRAAIDPAAMAPRPPSPAPTYDWAEPGAFERMFAAWAPHLPRAIARDGLDGLRRRVGDQALAIAADRPPAP